MGVLAGVAESGYFGGTRRAVAQRDAAAELIESFVGQQRGALGEVSLRDFLIGVGEPLGELRVVGQDEESAGIEIEAANRGDEGVNIGDQIVDGGAAFGVLEGRDVTGGLIEQDVEALPGLEGLAIEENFVAVEIDPLIGVFDDTAVDADAAGMNPAASLGARAEAGFR